MKHVFLSAFLVLAITAPQTSRAQAPSDDARLDLSIDAGAASSMQSGPTRTPWGGALLGGLGAAGGSMLLTYGVARGMVERCDQESSTFSGVLTDALSCGMRTATMSFLMGSLAFPAIIAGGVTLGGSLGGGHGRYDMTLIGSALGTGVGWGFLAAMAAVDTQAALFTGIVAFPLLQVGGALVAYHLSHRVRARRERQFGPSLAPMRGGAVLGLTGRF